jgi:UDP-N-acetylmuramate dehydrogenase
MPLAITDQVPLAPHTTLELGGPAQHVARITDRAALLEALAWAKARSLPVTILGGGSNVLVSDRGVAGLVLLMATQGIALVRQRDVVHATVEAGENWDAFVARSVQENLAGLECLSGIPGKVGATPIQNVGAYGQDVASSIVAVEVLDRSTWQTTWLDAAACEFGYRTSRFKRAPEHFIVLAVRFALTPSGPATLRYAELAHAIAARGEPPTLAAVRDAVQTLRRAKSMLLEPHDENRRSAGSFFLNPIVEPAQAEALWARAQALGLVASRPELPCYPQPDGRQKLSAAWLIDHSGTHKGERSGQIGVSSRHALALVHHGGASSAELLAFAAKLRERVRTTFGIELVPEPVMLGFDVPPLG